MRRSINLTLTLVYQCTVYLRSIYSEIINMLSGNTPRQYALKRRMDNNL